MKWFAFILFLSTLLIPSLAFSETNEITIAIEVNSKDKSNEPVYKSRLLTALKIIAPDVRVVSYNPDYILNYNTLEMDNITTVYTYTIKEKTISKDFISRGAKSIIREANKLNQNNKTVKSIIGYAMSLETFSINLSDYTIVDGGFGYFGSNRITESINNTIHAINGSIIQSQREINSTIEKILREAETRRNN